MKLSPIKREHIIEAGEYINHHGIQDNYLTNNYWVILPNGNEYPFKYLTRIAFQMTEGNNGTWLDFESNIGYRKYIQDLGFQIKYYREGISFFTKEEIEHFENIGGQKYRKVDDENVRLAQLLKPLVYKSNKWAELSLIENFVFKSDYHWQWSGTFKSYLWIRIYREGKSQKVFFILGVSSDGGLFYKIDCLRSNYTKSGVLTADLQTKFDDYLKRSDYHECFINKDELQKLDWEGLAQITSRFLYQYSSLYDELENIITPISDIETEELNRFIPTQAPTKTKTYLKKQRSYQGVIIDWKQKQSTSKVTGDAGENLVIEFEKEKLLNLGLHEKAGLVHKVKDGCGYDVLSFNEYGNEIRIEVKTTTGKEDEPFYFSINEKEYLADFPDNYFLYRLYEFRFNPNRTKYFVLSSEDFIRKAEFNATNFEVSIIK